MPDESAAGPERTERLTETIHELARERYKSHPDPPKPASPSLSWASLTRRTAIVGVLGSFGAVLFAGSAAAAPSGTYPASSGDPLLKFRADRLRLVERSGAPAAPSSGRVLLYTDSGDL